MHFPKHAAVSTGALDLCSPKFQREYIPIDLDFLRARQLEFKLKKKKNNIKNAYISLNLILGLYMQLANPKPSVALFATSLIILHQTASTTHQTSSCKLFSPLCLVYTNIQILGKPQHANGSLSLGQNTTLTIPVYPIKFSPASATSTWAICSVCGALPNGAVLCCAVWDGTMHHCKAVPQCTPYNSPTLNQTRGPTMRLSYL